MTVERVSVELQFPLARKTDPDPDPFLMEVFKRTPHVILKNGSSNVYLTSPDPLPVEGLQLGDFVFH